MATDAAITVCTSTQVRRLLYYRCVDWCTGEVLDMTHVARGVDDDGTLTIDVVMSGQVPVLPPDTVLTVLPYNERYIQTGPGNHSSHLATV